MRSYAFKRDANFWQPGVKYSNGIARLLGFSLSQTETAFLLSLARSGILGVGYKPSSYVSIPQKSGWHDVQNRPLLEKVCLRRNLRSIISVYKKVFSVRLFLPQMAFDR